MRALLSFALFALAIPASRAIACYNCVGKGCEDGSCDGDYCVDEFTSNSEFGTNTYSRGCYNAVAGTASRPPVPSGNYSCDVSVLGALTTSTCVCKTDNCNGGASHAGEQTGGGVTCELGKAGDSTGTCTGTYCRFGAKDLGVGCQYDDGFFYNLRLQPSRNFSGCFEKVDISSTQLQCSCRTKNCNVNATNTDFNRSHKVTCDKTDRYSDKQQSCKGNYCYISGVNTTGINGFDRGCMNATGTEPIMPFCMSTQMSGVGNTAQVQTCLCLTDNCNVDIETAVESMTPKTTTTARPTTTTMKPTTTTMKPTTTHHKKGAGALAVSSVLVATAAILAKY